MARSRAATVAAPDAGYADIIAWYADQLEQAAPPVGLEWNPVCVGPTWQWDNGWALPRLTLGWQVLAWCGVWLRDKHRNPWQFTPEQARFILWYFALAEDGSFLYHSAVLQRLKGWGKDPLAACLAVAAMFADVTFDRWDGDRPVGREEPNAWVQLVAVSQEQTQNTMKLFPSLISPEARKHYGIQVGKLNVYGLADTRQIQAVTSSPLAIEGGRPTLIVRNETQNWTDSNDGHTMAGAIEGNAAKSEGGAARILDICNAFRPGDDSVAQRTREGWDATQGDNPAAEQFGLLYDSLEAPPEAPLTADAAPAVIEAIRGDASWLSTKRILASILNPNNPPSESRRKWYNQIVAAEDALLDPLKWDQRAASDVVVGPDEPVALFFDGSKSDDHTGLVGVRLSDGHVFQLGIWRRPPQWNRQERWVVDRERVDARVAEVFDTHTVHAFFADPSDVRDDDDGERFWAPLMDEWNRRYGPLLKLWAVPSGDRRHAVAWDMRTPVHQQQFTEAVMTFVADVEREGSTFTHCGSAMLTQHAKNGRRAPNKYGISVSKGGRESPRKIDLLACAIGARMVRRMLLNKDLGKSKERPAGGRVW